MAKRDVSKGLLGEAGGVSARIVVFLLLAILVFGLAMFFSFQNSTPATVSFYNWRFTSSLADVVLLAFCLGALVMALLLLSFSLRSRFRKRAARQGQRQGGPAPGPAGSSPETGP
ncbi:MAG TPA: LapA family protein [Syntrophorhabdales bacterium]|nr:LapA family protein [Syntrophorhabdales bacterium]